MATVTATVTATELSSRPGKGHGPGPESECEQRSSDGEGTRLGSSAAGRRALTGLPGGGHALASRPGTACGWPSATLLHPRLTEREAGCPGSHLGVALGRRFAGETL